MQNLKHLEQWIRSLGWYGGKLNLIIKTEHEFEGFYGKASETWESRVSISISKVEEQGKIVVPDLEVIGHRSDNINSVAGKILEELKKMGYGPGN